MPTTSKTIIDSIHTKLDALLVAAGGSAIPYGIGSVAKGQQRTAPRIIWYDHEIQGEVIPLKRTTTNPRRWAEDLDRYQVQIWAIDTDGPPALTARENCQLTLHNLITATRQPVGAERGYGVESVLFHSYRKTPDGQAKKGIVLVVDVDIMLIVTNDVWPTILASWEGVGIILPSEESPQDILQEFTSEFTGEFTS